MIFKSKEMFLFFLAIFIFSLLDGDPASYKLRCKCSAFSAFSARNFFSKLNQTL